MKKRGLMAILLAAALGITSIQTVSATSTQDKLDDVNDQISGLLSEQGAVESEISSVQEQLATLMSNIDALAMDMEAKNGEIEEAEVDLEESIATQEKQYSDMKVRIRFMYENDNTSVLTILLESDSFADMLNRIRYEQDVYKYDRDLLTAYEENTKHIQEVKEELEEEMAELQEMEASYEAQEAELAEYEAELEATAEDYAEQIEAAEELAAQYTQQIAAEKAAEEARKKAAAEAAAKAAAAANGSSYSPSSSDSDTGTTVTSNGKYAQQDTLSEGLNPAQVTGVSGSDIVALARQYLGNPYVWGGTDPVNGTDCSGFTQYVLGAFGISICRTAAMQSRQGQAVSYDYAQPGDLVFYAYSSGYVYHVAIYEGNGMIIHASSPTTGIIESSINMGTVYCIKRMN